MIETAKNLTTIPCPDCQASLTISHPNIRQIVCKICGTISLIKDGEVESFGRPPMTLHRFKNRMGSSITIKTDEKDDIGEPITGTVVGAIRYDYAPGEFWEESLVLGVNNKFYFVQYDEGEITYMERWHVTASEDQLENAKNNKAFHVGGKRVTPTEVGGAEVTAVAGELLDKVYPGEQIFYYDGMCDGTQVFLEISDQEVEFYRAIGVETEPMSASDIITVIVVVFFALVFFFLGVTGGFGGGSGVSSYGK